MSITALDAASAYAKALARPQSDGPAAGAGFGQMVEGLMSNAVQAGRAAETAAAQQVTGKGDLVDVVTAVNAAETALETMVAVRDRVISAYQDIMRMPI